MLPGEADVPRYSDQRYSGLGECCKGKSSAKVGPRYSCQAPVVPVTKAVPTQRVTGSGDFMGASSWCPVPVTGPTWSLLEPLGPRSRETERYVLSLGTVDGGTAVFQGIFGTFLG